MRSPGPRIGGVTRLPRFERAYKRLDPQIQTAVDGAIMDLMKNPIPPGRRPKKVGGSRDIWKIRINDNFRMSFEIQGETAILRNVDTHDSLLNHP